VSADLEKGSEIIAYAKTHRVSVCNALDCLVIHEQRLDDLKTIASEFAEKARKIYADKPSLDALKGSYPSELLAPAEEEHYGTEFLSMTMSIKTVSSLEQALDHIAQHSSKHSEAIIAEDEETLDLFLRSVDAAAVYANTSTAFTDGAQFGMGAEIGISTRRRRVRGPLAFNELTAYEWIIRGNGEARA